MKQNNPFHTVVGSEKINKFEWFGVPNINFRFYPDRVEIVRTTLTSYEVLAVVEPKLIAGLVQSFETHKDKFNGGLV